MTAPRGIKATTIALVSAPQPGCEFEIVKPTTTATKFRWAAAEQFRRKPFFVDCRVCGGDLYGFREGETVTIKVTDPDLVQRIKSGEYTGFSISGVVRRKK